MHQLVCLTQTEIQKQVNLENELEDLRAKTKLVEEQLNRQKTITQNMFPTIAESHKNITSNRQISTKLANRCSDIGRNVRGDDYR